MANGCHQDKITIQFQSTQKNTQDTCLDWCSEPFWCHAGVTVIGEVNAWTSNVMNLIWLIGTFTFAVVLAVVTEDIVATVLVSLCLPLCCVYLFAVSAPLLCLPLCCVYPFTVSHLSDFEPWDAITPAFICNNLPHAQDSKQPWLAL